MDLMSCSVSDYWQLCVCVSRQIDSPMFRSDVLSVFQQQSGNVFLKYFAEPSLLHTVYGPPALKSPFLSYHGLSISLSNV